MEQSGNCGGGKALRDPEDFIRLGDAKISRVGIGTMRIVRGEEGTGAVLAALDAGANFINCGDFYNCGEGEMAVGDALRLRRREDAFISLKFGALRTVGNPPGMLGVDVAPEHVENYLAYSLRRLGTDYVDLYQPCRINPHIPVEETVGAVARLVEKGAVRKIGLTQVDGETLRRAHAVHPISLVELNYSLVDRSYEDGTMAVARELGIPVVAFGVLLSGVLGGSGAPGGGMRFRHTASKDALDNLSRHMSVAGELTAIAEEKGCTLAQLAIAWVLAQGADMAAIVGARKPDQATSAVAAAGVRLTPDDLARIERLVPKAEARCVYMGNLNIDEKGLFHP